MRLTRLYFLYMNPIRILFSAISGYGNYYLKTLFEEITEEQAVICGVIDLQPEKSGHFSAILASGVPIYSDIKSFFMDGNTADLTVISSPLQYHVPQAIIALKNGSNVLVDKPVGVTPGEIMRMIAVRNQTGRWVEVGYQWSFSDAIQHLKRDILDGKFGKPVRLKTMCLWPRPYAYFNRNNWAGKIWTDDGSLVLDSVANNACAHFLHNMFFLTGTEMHLSSVPESVTGQRFRAYDIQNYDTLVCRAITENGVEILFYASHVTENQVNPLFQFEYENGVITMDENSNGIVASYKDGTTINYGHPDADHQFKKLFKAIEKCSIPGPAICPPEAALSQTLCINALHELPNDIQTFPSRFVVIEKDRRWVKGLGEAMLQAYSLSTNSLKF
ncbi:MAG: gfo/Idh/MocA family oxidoreductase [Porphyromonadaceae bacterium]|nr:MAG: gfo/Idh/MocA family oxidoreductase [Porphyromonadaceae bacterium]